jgi:hypothetical protein
MAPGQSKPGASNPSWKGDTVGYEALHQWIRRHFPPTGQCELCGATARTEYASVGHTYTRNRADWTEICAPCHATLDGAYERSAAHRMSMGLKYFARRRETMEWAFA